MRAVCFTVMPGPQLASAVKLTRQVKARHPDIPTVWGGNFPSLYPEPVLNAPYIDWAVRGQGEHTFADLLEVLAERRDPEKVPGLLFRRADGSQRSVCVRLDRTDRRNSGGLRGTGVAPGHPAIRTDAHSPSDTRQGARYGTLRRGSLHPKSGSGLY